MHYKLLIPAVRWFIEQPESRAELDKSGIAKCRKLSRHKPGFTVWVSCMVSTPAIANGTGHVLRYMVNLEGDNEARPGTEMFHASKSSEEVALVMSTAESLSFPR